MGEYKVLTKEDSIIWKATLDKMGNTDIFYTPEYCEVFEMNGEGEPRLFVYQDEGHYICYPFLLRKINELPVCSDLHLDKEYFDIITPYGYGGPISNIEDEEKRKSIFKSFGSAFQSFCLENGIVTEFVRFHPVLKNHDDYLSVNPEYNRNTICIDLQSGEGEVENLVSKMRNKVKAAIKNGLTVRIGDKENLEVFIQQYQKSMEKNAANEYYFFPREFYYNLVRKIDDKFLTLLEVVCEEKVITSTIFLHFNDYVAYFLTGSEQEFLNYRPYNLLMSYASSKFKVEGYKYLHLGGGFHGNDELYRFKKTFTKSDPLDFYVGKKIHNPEIYRILTKDLQVEKDYFPLYRHPSIGEREAEKINN